MKFTGNIIKLFIKEMLYMSEKTINENKSIRILFQKLSDEKYRQRECKNVFIISVVPKGFKSIKFDEFEKQILKNENYNMANKFIVALSKLYIFDDNIFFLNNNYEEGMNFLEYYKDINRFIDDIMYNLTIINNGIYFVFNDLKIGLEITYWKVKIINFGCDDLKFIMDIFKSEGLFISNEYI